MSVRSQLRGEAIVRARFSCEWPGPDRCQIEKLHAKLEMSHLIPAGSGGDDTIENVWMLCKWHHDMYDGRVMMKLRELRWLALAYATLLRRQEPPDLLTQVQL